MTDSIQRQLFSARQQLVQSLRDGTSHASELVLRDHPRLADDSENALELILTEYLTRMELGQNPQPAEFYDRFPKWRDRIERLLKIDHALSDGKQALLPEVALLRGISGYRIHRPIGDGGMGTVYLAEQLSIRRQVALKILHPMISENRDVVERFHREAVTLGMLSHPNIATIHASGVESGIHYLAMEHCQGESLQTLLGRRDHPPAANADEGSSDDWYRLVLESSILVASAIAYAHAHGVLHRDIKPSNIIVNQETNDVWVVDFGLAKVLDSDHRTITQGMLGTPCFASPEQLTGGHIDERSDIYSLGTTIRRLLSRRGNDEAALEWIPEVSDGLRRVVGYAVEQEPELRYRSMESLRTDLEALASGQQPRIRRSIFVRPALLYAKRHRIQMIVASVCLCVLILLGTLYSTERDRVNRSRYRQHVESAVLKLEFAQLLTSSDAEYRRLVDYFAMEESGQDREELDPLREALGDLDTAISILPQRPEAYYYRAKTQFALGLPTLAAKQLDTALRREPGFAPARALRLLRNDETQGVRSDSNEFASMVNSFQPGWPKAWIAATHATTRRRWTNAAQAYGEILATDTEPFVGCYLESYLGRGSAYLESGRLGPAIEDLAAVKAQKPRAPEPALLIGKAYLLSGERSRAEEVFQRVHASALSRDSVALWVAFLYQREQRPGPTKQWISKIQNEYIRGLSNVQGLQRLKRWRAAELAVRELLRTYPQNANLLHQLSESLVNQARFSEAISAAQQAIRQDPRFAQPYVTIGAAYLRTGEFAGATRAFRQAIQLRPAEAYLRRGIGNQHQACFRSAEAAAMYRDAIRLDPNDASSQGGLGLAYERLGRFEDAIVHYGEAARLAPRVSNYYTSLARQFHRKEDWCAWIGACLTALELAPTDWAPAEMLFNAMDEEDRYFSCPDGGPHESCGMGARLVEVLQRITASDEDGRLLSILALAYCHVPEHRDYARALETARRAVEKPTEHLPDVLKALVQVSRHATGRALANKLDHPHILTFFPALPPYCALDALLESHGFPSGEEANRLLERFSVVAVTPVGEDRWRYLQGRIHQNTGRYMEATKYFRTITDSENSTEPILHLVECLRASGDEASEQELRRSITALSETGAHGSLVAQWDFDGDLTSSVGAQAITAHAAAPADHPSVSFRNVTIAGRSAQVAQYSRGTYFQIPRGLNPRRQTPLAQYTMILDVHLSFDTSLSFDRSFTAILQTDPDNEDNADWLAHPVRGLGFQDYGGVIRDRQWHRLALTVDTITGHLASFVDGRQVQRFGIGRYNEHGRFALQSAVLLFADESEENSAGSINSLQIRPHAMTPTEIATLGGPTADGIPLP